MVPRNQRFLVVLGKCEGCLCSLETLWERTSSMVQTLEMSSGLFHRKVGRFFSVGCERVAWGWRTWCLPSMRCWRKLGTNCVLDHVEILCAHPLSEKKKNTTKTMTTTTTTTENLAKTSKHPNWPNAVWPNAVTKTNWHSDFFLAKCNFGPMWA